MDLTPSPEQRTIVASVADVLAATMPISLLRELADRGDRSHDGFWRSAASLGWFGLGLAEDLGGAGYGLVEEMLMAKELGRHLTPGPLIATTLAARVAAYAGNVELAGALLDGSARAALAVARGDAVVAESSVSGTFSLHDAKDAAYLLISNPERAVLVAAADGADRVSAGCLDELSTRETCTLHARPAASLAAAADPVQQRGEVLVTAMLVGIAEATRDLATAYAKTRMQFGAPIGSFQAIKHRCADLAIGAATADAQLLIAALSVAERQPDAAYQVAAARVVASNAALSNARENIQIHAGMGFSWECDAHFYLKRVHVLAEQFGSVWSAKRVLLGPPIPSP